MNQILSEIESRPAIGGIPDKLEQTIDINLKKSETLRQSILKKVYLPESRFWGCRQAFEGRLV